MSTLTLLRHGQAAFGAERYDELSSLGTEQARATGAFFTSRGLAFTRVICGPRQRHRQTAQYAAATQAFDLDTSLDEFAEGEQVLHAATLRTGLPASERGAMPRRDQLRLYSEQIELWAQGRAPIGGVAPADAFRARVSAWLRSATSGAQGQQHLLTVTSAGVIAAIVCEVLGQPDAAMATHMMVLRNTSITTLLFSAKGIGLQDFNATQHLPPALLTAI